MKISRRLKERKRRAARTSGPSKGRPRRHITQMAALRSHRERLAQIAQDSFHTVLSTRSYFEDVFIDADTGLTTGTFHDLLDQIMHSRQETSFYPHYSPLLAGWEKGPCLSVRDVDSADSTSSTSIPHPPVSTVKFEFVSSSSLAAARRVWLCSPDVQAGQSSIGILNSASPKRPGGASLSGGSTQEEFLVRQTTLIDSLQNSAGGQLFYAEHRAKSDGSGLHDHALLYSSNVIAFKDDLGRHIAPYSFDVVSSVPVNAGTVRTKFLIDGKELQDGISSVMKERMARILRLFEERGDRILVLGAFGCGQFCNSPDMIGELWADLLATRDAKFRGAFDKIIFSVSSKHLPAFENAFNSRVLESELVADMTL